MENGKTTTGTQTISGDIARENEMNLKLGEILDWFVNIIC